VKVDESERKLDNSADTDEALAVVKEFEKTSADNSGTEQDRVLRYESARTLFRLGIERLYADHDKAVGNLTEARKLYADLAKDSADRDKHAPILAQEAMMNIAKADESLGDLDKALEGYKKLANAYPKSTFGKLAKERVEFLEKDDNLKRVAEVYAKLNEQETQKPQLPPLDVEKK
jgi:tetratricopeptide (TPR) repeat protein